MNEAMKIKIRVAEEAEKLYGDAQKIGELAAQMLTSGGQEERSRSQMTSLRSIAESTLKSSDVLDYIKKQMARQRSWRDTPREGGDSLGEKLKKIIEGKIRTTAQQIAKEMQSGEESDEVRIRRELQVRLLLVRQFVRQVVVQYEYGTIFMGGGNRR